LTPDPLAKANGNLNKAIFAEPLKYETMPGMQAELL
jgi:hypothetical protein